MEKFKELNWRKLEKYIEANADTFDWKKYQKYFWYKRLSHSFIEKFGCELNWDSISIQAGNGFWSLKFIKKFKHKINFFLLEETLNKTIDAIEEQIEDNELIIRRAYPIREYVKTLLFEENAGQ